MNELRIYYKYGKYHVIEILPYDHNHEMSKILVSYDNFSEALDFVAIYNCDEFGVRIV